MLLNKYYKIIFYVAPILFLTACAPPAPSITAQLADVQLEHARNQDKLAFTKLKHIVATTKDVNSSYELGYFYFYGIGTEPDPLTARHYLQLAAAKGSSKARAALLAMDAHSDDTY